MPRHFIDTLELDVADLRTVIDLVPAREILLGGGNIHCITQQVPTSEREL